MDTKQKTELGFGAAFVAAGIALLVSAFRCFKAAKSETAE